MSDDDLGEIVTGFRVPGDDMDVASPVSGTVRRVYPTGLSPRSSVWTDEDEDEREEDDSISGSDAGSAPGSPVLTHNTAAASPGRKSDSGLARRGKAAGRPSPLVPTMEELPPADAPALEEDSDDGESDLASPAARTAPAASARSPMSPRAGSSPTANREEAAIRTLSHVRVLASRSQEEPASADLLDKVQELDRYQDRLLTELHTAQTRADRAESEQHALESELSRVRASLQRAEDDAERARRARDAAQSGDSGDGVALRAELEASRQELRERSSQWHDDLAAKDAALEMYEEQLTRYESQHAQVPETRAELDAARQETVAVAKQLEDVQAAFQAYKDEHRSREMHYMTQFKLVSADWEAAQTQLRSLQAAQDAQVKSTMASAASYRNGASSENATLVRSLKAQSDTALAQAKESNAKVRKLETELASVKHELHLAQQAGAKAARGAAASPAGSLPPLTDEQRQRVAAGLAPTPESSANVTSLIRRLGQFMDEDRNVAEGPIDDDTPESIGARIGQLADVLDDASVELQKRTSQLYSEHFWVVQARPRLAELESENARLRDQVADLSQANEVLRGENAMAVRHMLDSSKPTDSAVMRRSGRSMTVSGSGPPRSAPQSPLAVAAPGSGSESPTPIASPIATSDDFDDNVSSFKVSTSSLYALNGHGGDDAANAPPAKQASAAAPAKRTSSKTGGRPKSSSVSTSQFAIEHRREGDNDVSSVGPRTARMPTALRSTVTADDVDLRVVALKKRFTDNGMTLPLRKVADFQYTLGNKKVKLNLVGGKLVVRTGGGHQSFLEFLERQRL